ncbi:MAG: spermidine synthase, partial [Actinomycetes bacterium]
MRKRTVDLGKCVTLAGVVLLFGAASFLGAALLFLIEPMLAKLVLPAFGGSPMVWNTCTLFFQVLLLAGYAYVHVSTRRLGSRRQPWLHLVLLVLPLLVLPVALPSDTAPPADGEPALWLLRVLALAAGLPFALLATTGPLLQRWFSWTDHRRAHDPYFLYAASNAGSVVGLLGYPFAVEPTVGLADQTRWWSMAYVGFALLVAACGVVAGLASRRTPVLRTPVLGTPEPDRGSPGPAVIGGPSTPSWRTRLGWVAVAFVPSSLMLGVTTHVSTDIAAIPLFWTVPLAVYLATFVVAFGRASRTPPRGAALLAAVLCLPVLVVVARAWIPAVWVSVALDLALLTAAGLAAHGRLAATRPRVEHLTGFYLLVSLGGALGGLVNGLLAPVLLDRPLEYPVVVGLVPL